MRRRPTAFCAGLLLLLPSVAITQDYHSDPAPTISVTPSETILTKELNAYRNYGVVDGAADILYTGETGTWNFTLPVSLDPWTISDAFFRVFLVLDDHYAVLENLYALSVNTNGTTVSTGSANLPHGNPFNGQFTNWIARDYMVSLFGAPGVNSITIANTSNTAATGWRDWMAVDRIELHVATTNTVTPEPVSIALLGTGFVGVGFARRRRKRSTHLRNAGKGAE